MNIDNMKKVRDAIANEENFFHMDYWDTFGINYEITDATGNVAPDCGTASCIGGWTESIMKKEGLGKQIDEEPTSIYAWLGLDRIQSEILFYNGYFNYSADGERSNPWSLDEDGQRKDLEDITRSDAVEYLDECIEAGELI